VRRGMSIGLSIGLLLAASLFWGMLLLQAENSVFSRAPLLDELYYLDRAAEIFSEPSAEQPDDSPPYFMSPLYPLLVAVTGSGNGLSEIGVLPRGSLLGIRLMQVACWFGVFLLLRRIAARTYGADLVPGLMREILVWLPAILFALYRPAAVFSLSILLEMPLLLLLTLMLDLLTPGQERLWRGPLLGAVLGMAILLRGTALFLVPVAVWVVWRQSRGTTHRWRALIGLAVSLLVVVAPAAIHNSLSADRPAGPTLNGGLNLYIGNGPQANGFYRNALPGDWREDPAGTAYLAGEAGSSVSLPEADALWYRAAIEAVKADPVRSLRLYSKKIWLHFQGWEIDQLVPLEGWTSQAPLLRGLVVPWRAIVVLGLAALGLLFGGAGTPDVSSNSNSQRAIRVWFWVLVSLVLGQSLFFVISRYRLMLSPALCLLAGAAVSAGWGRLANPGPPGRARWHIGTAAILALALSQPWGLGEVKELWAGQAKANQAHRWALLAAAEASFEARAANNEQAEQLYLEAMTGPATQAEWWLALALVQVDQGDDEGAEETLTEGADLHPGELEIQRMLLNLLLKQARTDEALTRAETLLVDHPEDADTLHNYAILLARNDRMDEALATATELMDLHPQDVRGYSDLGILLARMGRTEEARAVFERGLGVVPGDKVLESNLGVLDRTSNP
jgi:Flp pilus assembly protein TadD